MEIKSKNYLRIFVPLILIVVLGVALGKTVIAAGNPAKTQTPLDRYADTVSIYQTQMSDPNLSSAEKEKLDRKIQPELAEATKLAERSQKVFNGPLPTLPKQPAVVGHKLPDGIEKNPYKPRTASHLFLNTAWRKTINSKLTYLVYAGSYKDNPALGVVYMEKPGTGAFLEIRSPTESGAFTIVDEKDLRLTLTTDSGSTFHFDVPNMQLLDEQGNPLSSEPERLLATPVPAYP